MFLQWLNEEKLIQRLTELIHTGKDEEVRAVELGWSDSTTLGPWQGRSSVPWLVGWAPRGMLIGWPCSFAETIKRIPDAL